jgi:phage terminase large subunit GpA-like protein
MIETAELLRAPRRISPSEAASKYLSNERGAWSLALTPMWQEPLDLLASRDCRGIAVVGPARTGKTFGLVHGAIAYSATCAPGDLLVMQTSQDQARDFSRTEVDRVLRHSPELAARLTSRSFDDNVYDKYFRSGNALKIGWPTITQLSGRTFQLVMLPDFDRPANRDNVDGEGPLWDLALKRTETFLSRGKCLAESSPGDDYAIPDWRPATAHEAPPARGIMSLYNAGTRARWYWPCRHCGEYFQAEPGLGPFQLPEFDELVKLLAGRDPQDVAAEFARVVCVQCGGLHGQEDRLELNRRGHWVHEGESIAGDGAITGKRRASPIASYWLGGVSAVFQRWDSLLYRYFAAVQTFARLGDESQLRAVSNTDLGIPYLPRSLMKRRTGRQLEQRAEHWERGTVPKGVRFLTAAADVQAHRFVIQVHGWGIGLESWLIDRFTVSSSKRAEGERFAALDPAAYLEDWDVLRDVLIGRTYPLADEPAQRLPLLMTLCDSGGREGVTSRAYDFWRSLRRDGQHRRFFLVKGRGEASAQRMERSFPDTSARTDRRGGGRGDVPVWLLGVNIIKDQVANDLARDLPGPGFIHLPDWLDTSTFDEFTAEVRTHKGWVRPGGAPNEALDLLVYNRAAVVLLRGENINWDRPPAWAVSRDTQVPGSVTMSLPAVIETAAPAAHPRFDRPNNRGVHRPTRSWVRNW